MLDALEEPAQLLRIEHRLSDREVRSGLHLPGETLQLLLEIERHWLRATPTTNRVGSPIGLPPGSSPWLSRRTTLVSPMLSMSNTAVASG